MLPLLNTKLRRKVLAYAFAHSDENYYVREFSSLIDEDPGNLSRELRRLEEDGLFVSEERGNMKFYALNKKYPLYQEIKNIIFVTEGVSGQLRSFFSVQENIVLAFIHGSFARNQERLTSDIDLVVVGKSIEEEILPGINDLESRFNREINMTFYSEEEFTQQRKIKGSFLNVVLSGEIILIKGTLDAR